MVLDDGVLRPRPIGDVVAQAAAGVRRRLRPRHLRGRVPRDHRLVRGSGRQDLRDRRCVRSNGAGHGRAQPLHPRPRDGRSAEGAHRASSDRARGSRCRAVSPIRGSRGPPSVSSTSSRSRSTRPWSAPVRPFATCSPTAATSSRSCCATTVTATPTTTRGASAAAPPGRARRRSPRRPRPPTIGSSPRAGVPASPHAARRPRVRLVPRHLRGRGVPPPPAVRGVEHRSVDPRSRRGRPAPPRAAHVPRARRDHLHLHVRIERPRVDRRGWQGHREAHPAAWSSRGRRSSSRRSSKAWSTATAASTKPVRRSGRPRRAWSPTCWCSSPGSDDAPAPAGATAATRRSARSTRRRVSTSC